MLLRKTLKLNDVQLKMEGTTGKFAGYASVFGGVDSYGDTIVKGAFDSTLRANGKPKMYLEHAWSNFAAAGAAVLPIGKYDVAKQDDHGLYVEGELTPNMSLASDVRASMEHGTIDGLSIGGYIKKGDYDETDTGRVIRKWTDLVEISVVAMPADSAARIDSVKGEKLDAAIAEIETIRDVERFLRDAGRFDADAAKSLVARFKTLFAARDAGEVDEAKALTEIQARFARLQKFGASA